MKQLSTDYFTQLPILDLGNECIAWNHTEFEVNYPSLIDEVRVGDYYLRVLLQQNQPTGFLSGDIKDPIVFFDELYRRFLTAPKPALRLANLLVF